MANHPSAEKRHRQNLKRRARNRAAKSQISTSMKKVVELAQAGEKDKAAEQFKAASSLIDKAAIHGVLHKNNAQRKVSRLQQRLTKISAS